MTIKCCCCDLNWAHTGDPVGEVAASAPQDWAFIDPQTYFDWHREIGNNVTFCQAYAFGGYAFYPSRLGPVAPGPGSLLLPKLYELAQAAGMPFWSYFCVGANLVMGNMRPGWTVPSAAGHPQSWFLAPESPWTDLLCARIDEFLRQYPVDWLLFDWFVYGDLHTNEYPPQPAWYMREPFEELFGRPLPATAEEIAPAESLRYKREMLARQFRRIRAAVKTASPATKITFNVPYWAPAEAIWRDHPMLNESDGLFAESSDDAIVEWLLDIRKPGQRVMTTVVGRVDGEWCDPNSWRKWHARGCDLFGYAWGTPPDFRPHPAHAAGIEIVRAAFHEIG